jgi:hypothetical protein
MLTRPLQPAILISLLTLGGVPAAAETHVDLPGVEIRIGHTAPPPLRHEKKPHRPGSDYVWLGGGWDWQGSDWVWVPGRWERPAYHHATWVAPRTRREGEAWRVEPGHWSHQKLVEGDEYRRWRSEHASHEAHHDRDHEDRNDHEHR